MTITLTGMSIDARRYDLYRSQESIHSSGERSDPRAVAPDRRFDRPAALRAQPAGLSRPPARVGADGSVLEANRHGSAQVSATAIAAENDRVSGVPAFAGGKDLLWGEHLADISAMLTARPMS
jgi:hypothetical protein